MEDISEFFKVETVKVNKTDKSKKSDIFMTTIAESVKNEKIDLNEYADLVNFYKTDGSIIGIKKFMKICKKIDSSEFEEYIKTKFKRFYSKNISTKIVKKCSMNLSQDQIDATTDMLDFLVSEKETCFGLFGYAGTGKLL